MSAAAVPNAEVRPQAFAVDLAKRLNQEGRAVSFEPPSTGPVRRLTGES
jgi:hypothetical protein